MARQKKNTVENTVEKENVLYRVTSKEHNAVFLGNKTISFDENNQAVVTEDEYKTLSEMGILI